MVTERHPERKAVALVNAREGGLENLATQKTYVIAREAMAQEHAERNAPAMARINARVVTLQDTC